MDLVLEASDRATAMQSFSQALAGRLCLCRWRRHPTDRPARSTLVPASRRCDAPAGGLWVRWVSSGLLHLPGKVDGLAHRTRLRPIKIGLDLVMCLHARRHAKG